MNDTAQRESNIQSQLVGDSLDFIEYKLAYYYELTKLERMKPQASKVMLLIIITGLFLL